MITVWIPSLLRDLTGGLAETKVKAKTVRELIAQLDLRHPGLAKRLLQGERLRPGLMIVVDGVNAQDGLRTRLPANCEVHFVPALSGGAT